jgi:hypothetical protein
MTAETPNRKNSPMIWMRDSVLNRAMIGAAGDKAVNVNTDAAKR